MGNEAKEEEATRPLLKRVKDSTGGAFGAGLVLIVCPSAALILGIDTLQKHSSIGLPILAIFGIMILFGALALISAVFARLELSCPTEALALPPGSIRAAIALALIVLFALISVMLYQSLSTPYSVDGLSYEQKNAMLQEPSNRVLAIHPRGCADAPPNAAPCTPLTMRYTVHLRQSPGSESTDLAKQLLILIGTLMTSVTSFYFASRSAEATAKAAVVAMAPVAAVEAAQRAAPPSTATLAPTPPPPPPGEDGHEAHVDGCDAPIENATADIDLPAARGGVAS